MVPLLTTQQMKNIDSQAIDGNVNVGFSYMLKAAMGLYERVAKRIRSRDTQEICILCGKGNNGGDGYVLGRLLFDNGYKVVCYGLCDSSELKGEAKKAVEEYIEKEAELVNISSSDNDIPFERFSLIVDAMLGTGIKGDPRGSASDIIKVVNSMNIPVISIDTPSGLNNDTGEAGNPCISASETVTMGFPKVGHMFHPGRRLTGRLTIKDLGYPDEIVKNNSGGLFIPDVKQLTEMMPERRPAGSKFDHGLTGLVCGSAGMAGSACLAASAAMRTGCGMVHMAVPESMLQTFSIKLTEPVLHSCKETSAGSFSKPSLDSILSLSRRMNSLLIGPGLSRNQETLDLVRKLLKNITLPAVLDADGINAFRDNAGLLKEKKCSLVLTPHEGEWKRLFGEIPKDPEGKINAVKNVSDEYNITLLLKGNPTIIGSPDKPVYLIPAGNSGMATAGSGDVLSGIIASLLAQGLSTFDTAVFGASIHGLAGEEASFIKGEHAVIASDIVDCLSLVLRKISDKPVKSLIS